MKTLQHMTRQEISLLLYFESCAVDHNGKVHSERISDNEREIAKRWSDEGFIQFGRIALQYARGCETSWVFLSDEAWSLAHEERKTRAKFGWENKNYLTTQEKRDLE